MNRNGVAMNGRSRCCQSAALGLTFICLVAISGVTGCGVDNLATIRVQNDLQQSLNAAMIGNTQTAKTFADQAIAMDPDEVGTYVHVAGDPSISDQGRLDIDAVFESVGDYKTAEHYLQSAISHFPNSYEAYERLVYVQQMLGETAAAIQTAKSEEGVLEKQTAKGNINDTKLNALADAYWAAGDHSKAAATYQRVMSIYTSNSDIYNDAAYNYAVANDVPNLKQALNYANLALAKAQKEQETDQQIGAIRDTIGWVQYRMGDYADALTNIEFGVAVAERLPEQRYHLAMVYYAMGNKAAAMAEVQKVLRLAPDYADAKALDARLNGASDQISDNNLIGYVGCAGRRLAGDARDLARS